MGNVVAGYASSHAFTFVPPSGWETFRNRNRESYARRYGQLPPSPPGVHDESLQDAAGRYGRIEAGLERVRRDIREDRLDALIIIGDDQNENFDGSALPQIAVHTGEDFALAERFGPAGLHWPGAPDLSTHLLVEAVEAGFDVTGVREFRESTLRSHAHGEIVANILGEYRLPVVLVFLNAIHVPALAPQRCFAFGQVIAEAVRSGRPEGERVGVYASGGLSHFTAGYPWPAYEGAHTHGSICADFDRRCLEQLSSGRAGELGDLSSKELLDNGNIELRSWICAAGAVGGETAWEYSYEPIPRAIMGMAVAWTGARAAAQV